MKTTMDIPDELYRSLKARAAIEGKTIREVAVNLFRGWVEEVAPDKPPSAHAEDPREAWLARWQALGDEMKRQNADPRSAVQILLDDRR